MEFISFYLRILAVGVVLLVAPADTTPAEVEVGTHICIIGGGVSGLTVANSLQDRGYTNVHLYEAGDRFGGKADTFRSTSGKSIFMEKGPVLYTNSMRYTLRQVQKGNLTTIPFDVKNMSPMDPKSGAIFPKISFSPVLTAKFKSLADKFKSYWDQIFESGALEMGFNSAAANAKLDELSMPIEKWLSERNLIELLPFFYTYVTSQGYGDVKDIAVLYALKLMVAEDIDGMLLLNDETGFQVKEGFDTFVDRMADPVRNKHVGWRAVKIERLREKGTQLVTFRVGKSQITRTCGKTILAFPPLRIQLDTLIRDFSRTEKQIFAQVKINKYMSSGNVIPNLQRNNYVGLVPIIASYYSRDIFPRLIPFPGDGSVVLLMKWARPYYTAYSWIYGDYAEAANEDDVSFMLTKLTATIKKLHPFAKTVFTSVTEYFPHVTGQSIRDGFYHDFDSIQGDGGVYYATTLLTLETINGAIEMGEKFVEKYF